MKNTTLIFTVLILLGFASCKKYQEDVLPSTYTPQGRLKSNGVWIIERMVNLSDNSEISVINPKSHYYQFEKNTYAINGNKFSFSTDLNQYSDFLKPILQPLMTNPNQEIILGNSPQEALTQSNYALSSDKTVLTLKNCFSFGNFASPESYFNFNVTQSIDMDFKIIRLEFSKMVIEYDNLLRIELKKIPVPIE
jgi:hypothetical protein